MIGPRHLQTALLAAFTAGLAGSADAQDAGSGARVFQTYCGACHSADQPPRNKIGPSLIGVVGRKAGTAPGFNYSAAMKAYGQTWSAANLDAFLAAVASKTVPGTKMTFFGVKDLAKRANLIAFLKAQK